MFFLVFLEFFLSFFGGPELFSFNRKGFLRNQKTKKPKLFGEVLVSGQKMVFFVFLEFSWFFWFRFLKTQKKKNLGFFWFFEGSLT